MDAPRIFAACMLAALGLGLSSYFNGFNPLPGTLIPAMIGMAAFSLHMWRLPT